MAAMTNTVSFCKPAAPARTVARSAAKAAPMKSAFTGVPARALMKSARVSSKGSRTVTTMAGDLFQVYILSADGSELFYSTEVEAANLPTPGGRMQILPNHQAMMTPVQAGTITIKTKSEDVKVTTSDNGFARQETNGQAPAEVEMTEGEMGEGGLLRILLMNAEFEKEPVAA